MRFFDQIAVLVAAVVPFVADAAPLDSRAVAGQIIPGQYIIQLKPGTTSAQVASHKAHIGKIHARNIARRGVKLGEKGGIFKEYGFGKFKGYAGSFDAATVEALKKMPEVLYVEKDSIMTTLEVDTQAAAPYDLASISSHTNGSATDYLYDDRAGEGFFNYIVDTGIRLTHVEFGGRAIWGYNAVNDLNTDNQGHGTHVTGTVIGSTYGVAKKSTAVAVKIFENGSGSTSTVIKGFEWAFNDIVAQNRTNTAVINMSLGGAASQAWDAAITEAWNAGVLAVVAAGNENRDATLDSPARSPECITVGSVGPNNIRYSGGTGSNYGPAVDIWAGGVQILSSYYYSDTATAILTGTSMATPHVTGLVSYLRSVYGALPAADIKALLFSLATPGLVQDGQGAANLLAYNGIDATSVAQNVSARLKRHVRRAVSVSVPVLA